MHHFLKKSAQFGKLSLKRGTQAPMTPSDTLSHIRPDTGLLLYRMLVLNMIKSVRHDAFYCCKINFPINQER